MKAIILILIGFLMKGIEAPKNMVNHEDGVMITVTIENVGNSNGSILIALHSSDTFMKGPGIKNAKVTGPEKGPLTVTFTDVKPGTYAILCLHDENDNKQMDFDPSGMPREAYGSSNNNSLIGPPTFEDSKFEVTNQDLELHIRF